MDTRSHLVSEITAGGGHERERGVFDLRSPPTLWGKRRLAYVRARLSILEFALQHPAFLLSDDLPSQAGLDSLGGYVWKIRPSCSVVQLDSEVLCHGGWLLLSGVGNLDEYRGSAPLASDLQARLYRAGFVLGVASEPDDQEWKVVLRSAA